MLCHQPTPILCLFVWRLLWLTWYLFLDQAVFSLFYSIFNAAIYLTRDLNLWQPQFSHQWNGHTQQFSVPHPVCLKILVAPGLSHSSNALWWPNGPQSGWVPRAVWYFETEIFLLPSDCGCKEQPGFQEIPRELLNVCAIIGSSSSFVCVNCCFNPHPGDRTSPLYRFAWECTHTNQVSQSPGRKRHTQIRII